MSDRTCELLEPRRLLSDTLDSSGALQIVATPGDDIVGLSIRGGKLRVDITGTLSQFSATSVHSISIDLGDGADYFAIAAGVGPVYCLGGLGNDTIFGGDAADTITAGGGKDFVSGGAGDDRIDGGPTADHLFGDDGADRIYGSDANDTLEGVAGVDRLFGGPGNDSLSGGSSNDKLYGDDGNDTLAGGNQNDLLTGGTGDDSILGDAGDDTLLGLTGEDALFGGSGNDSLDAGDGDDHLNGDAGLDSLSGGDGNDALAGGYDHDTLIGNGGADRLFQREKKTDDQIVNLSDDDAVITFINEEAAWTDHEIAQVDEGLGWLVDSLHNTKLLKRSDGQDVVILRMVTLGEDILADNMGDGRIRFADLAFAYGDVGATMVHELAHNWDTEDENPGLKTFFDLSRWRKRGGGWTYDPNADFANDYGRTNPYEDFATSMEVYFSRTKGPALWMAKWSFIRDFLETLRT